MIRPIEIMCKLSHKEEIIERSNYRRNNGFSSTNIKLAMINVSLPFVYNNTILIVYKPLKLITLLEKLVIRRF